MTIQYQDQCLTIFESALFRTTSSVLQTADFVLVVDPNWLPKEVQTIVEYVDSVKGDQPVYLLFTHSDYDHIIGYGAFPDATVIASRAFQDNSKKESILEQIRDFDDQYYIKRDYPIVYPNVDVLISEDGQELTIGSTKLIFYLASGHNEDGIFTLVNNYWFAGDYLSNVEFPYIYYSVKEYIDTLDICATILNETSDLLLISGHGDYTNLKHEIQTRINNSFEYIYTMIDCVEQQKEFPLKAFLSHYDFPKVMTNFHVNNMLIFKKEFTSS